MLWKVFLSCRLIGRRRALNWCENWRHTADASFACDLHKCWACLSGFVPQIFSFRTFCVFFFVLIHDKLFFCVAGSSAFFVYAFAAHKKKECELLMDFRSSLKRIHSSLCTELGFGLDVLSPKRPFCSSSHKLFPICRRQLNWFFRARPGMFWAARSGGQFATVSIVHCYHARISCVMRTLSERFHGWLAFANVSMQTELIGKLIKLSSTSKWAKHDQHKTLKDDRLRLWKFSHLALLVSDERPISFNAAAAFDFELDELHCTLFCLKSSDPPSNLVFRYSSLLGGKLCSPAEPRQKIGVKDIALLTLKLLISIPLLRAMSHEFLLASTGDIVSCKKY